MEEMDQIAGTLGQDVQPAETPAAGAPASNAKVIEQARLDKLMGNARKAGFDLGYEKALQQLAANYSTTSPAEAAQSGGASGDVKATVKELVDKEFESRTQLLQQKAEAEHWQNEANKIVGKVHVAQKDFPEIYQVIDDFGLFAHNAHVLKAIMDVEPESFHDVLKEMQTHPQTFIQISNLVKEGTIGPIRTLVKSIQTNKTATQAQQAPQPLNQIKPSNIGTDNGPLTVEDLRARPEYQF